MSDKKIGLRILIIALVFGLVLIGCDDLKDDGTTKFEGRWAYQDDWTQPRTLYMFDFWHNELTIRGWYPKYKGRFSYTDSMIHFDLKSYVSGDFGGYDILTPVTDEKRAEFDAWIGTSWPYQLDGDRLTLTFPSGKVTLKKQW